jgi:large subunit ribosomal protein L7/L12
MDIKKIVEEVKGLTLIEMNDLVKALEEEFGVSAAAMAMAGPAAGGAAAPQEEEKTEFDVILKEVPADKKLAVIKVVKDLTGLGLKEAKDVVDGAPKAVKEGIAKEAAKEVADKITAAGGVVEIK